MDSKGQRRHVRNARYDEIFESLFVTHFVGGLKPGLHCRMPSHWTGISNCSSGLVYIARSGDLYKIGFTSLWAGTKTLERRIHAISKGLRIDFNFERGLFAACGRGLENALHSQFKNCRFWAPYQNRKVESYSTEIFRLSPADCRWISDVQEFNGEDVRHFQTIGEVGEYISEARPRPEEQVTWPATI